MSFNNRGRPPEAESVTEVIPPIRVTKKQKATYKRFAEAQGLSLSAWIKMLADNEIKERMT